MGVQSCSIVGERRLIFYDAGGKSGASAQGFDHGTFVARWCGL